VILVKIEVRVASPETVEEICRTVRQAFARYERPGWLGGRCMVRTSDPQQVIVVEEWGTRNAFDAWYSSPARFEYEKQLTPLLVGPFQFEVFEEV
jgi:quinol monooxygenase YgiN